LQRKERHEMKHVSRWVGLGAGGGAGAGVGGLGRLAAIAGARLRGVRGVSAELSLVGECFARCPAVVS
jgi:hypothetical protein